MIAALAAGLIAGPWWTVFPASTDTVTLVAMAPFETYSANERACADLWAASVLDGTAHYRPHDMVVMGSAGDFLPRATVGADHVSLEVSVAASQVAVGIDLLCEMVYSPRLSADALKLAHEGLPFRNQGVGAHAFIGRRPEWRSVEKRLVLQFHQRLFRPERLSLSASGPVDEMALRSEWSLRQPRTFPKRPREVLGGKWQDEAADHPGGWILEIAGDEVSTATGLQPATLLAACALGVGKGSSLFRVLRQAEQLSYRQEAALWPTEKGLRWRAWLRRPDPVDDPVPTAPVARLQADVDAWTENDLLRAKATLQQSLEARGPLFPIRFDAERPITGQVPDLARLACWWPLKSGVLLDRTALIASAASVDLDTMKSSARTLLANATAKAWR